MSYSFDRMNRRLRGRWGRAVTYTPAGGGAAATITMVRVPPASMDEGLDGPNAVIYWAVLSDFAVPPASGALLTIDGTDYVVNEVRPEVEGGGLHLIASR